MGAADQEKVVVSYNPCFDFLLVYKSLVWDNAISCNYRHLVNVVGWRNPHPPIGVKFPISVNDKYESEI